MSYQVCQYGVLTEPIIGLYAHEREETQRVEYDFGFTVAAGEPRSIDNLVARLNFVLHAGEFVLVEAASAALVACLLHPKFVGADTSEAWVDIRKLDVLKGRGVPFARLSKPRAAVNGDIIFENEVVRVGLGSEEISTHWEQIAREDEQPSRESLYVARRRVRAGTH